MRWYYGQQLENIDLQAADLVLLFVVIDKQTPVLYIQLFVYYMIVPGWCLIGHVKSYHEQYCLTSVSIFF